MTEEEKKELRALKKNVYETLVNVRLRLYRKHADALATDKRIQVYIDGLLDNPDRHNLYEFLKIKRFLTCLMLTSGTRKR